MRHVQGSPTLRFDAAAERLRILPEPLPDGPAELMPVFTDGRLRPRLAPSADRPAGGRPRPPRSRTRPARRASS